jgi:hypothetical protein
MLVSCLVYSSNLKMAGICSSETLVDFQRTTRRYIPEDKNLDVISSAGKVCYIRLTVSPHFLLSLVEMWWNQFRASGAFTFNTLGNYYKTSSDED